MTARVHPDNRLPGLRRKRDGTADVFEQVIPVRIISAGNAREHHMGRHRRVKAEREATALYLRDLPKLAAHQVARITLARVAPRALDGHDNLRSALKGVADEVTARLGCSSDRDPRLTFTYDQDRGGVREYAVRVTVAIEARP